MCSPGSLKTGKSNLLQETHLKQLILQDVKLRKELTKGKIANRVCNDDVKLPGPERSGSLHCLMSGLPNESEGWRSARRRSSNSCVTSWSASVATPTRSSLTSSIWRALDSNRVEDRVRGGQESYREINLHFRACWQNHKDHWYTKTSLFFKICLNLIWNWVDISYNWLELVKMRFKME